MTVEKRDRPTSMGSIQDPEEKRRKISHGEGLDAMLHAARLDDQNKTA